MASPTTQKTGSLDSVKAYDSGSSEDRDVAVRPAGVGQKIKRHCMRWWWLHIIIFCLSFLIISLCLVYVGMPRIAQSQVNDSHLEMTDIQFLDPTSGTVTLTQKAILHQPSIFTPTLDPFNASLWLVTDGVLASAPMTNLLMPRIHALHPRSNASIINQTVTILNLDQITDYATQVITKQNVSTALIGRTSLHLGTLPTVKVNYNTTPHYAGLNGLAGFNVTDARINTTVPTGQPNLRGNAFIPNPSVLTVAMGNVTLSLATEKEGIVGNATVNDLTIRPGDNYFPMTAVVNQTKVLNSMGTDGFVNLTITGTSSVYNGHHITYYEKALSSNVLNLHMNIQQIIKDSMTAS